VPEELSGIIERITFHNQDNGFVVLRVQTGDKRGLVTVIGTLATVIAGEYVEAVGEWVQDRAHGLQFRAQRLQATPPHTPAGLIKYLGSGLIKGIGPTYARRIVETFKERTLEVIDSNPDYLSEVKGLGPTRIERIARSWQEQKGIRSIMVFLQSHGVGTASAVRIFKAYGDDAIEKVRSNPYRLADDVWGFGFKRADELARSLGLAPDSPQRAEAAVRYVLHKLSEEGHVGYPEAGVIEATFAELRDEASGHQVSREAIGEAVASVAKQGEIVREQDTTAIRLAELTDLGPLVFSKPLFLAEMGVARAIQQLKQQAHPLPPTDVEAAIRWVESQMGVELAPTQREAIRAATQQKVLVITGGPGVGKTTIVRGILEIFRGKSQRVALCAPTGRAAKRLAESTGHDARTIHRLLEFDPVQATFRRNRELPLEIDLLVVDEASMVDTVLMNQLLRAVPPTACVVLVGDVDQLPSVGPGAVLSELIASGEVPVVRLTEIFRQAQSSYIVRAAHAVNAGKLPVSAAAGSGGDFFFIEVASPESIIDRIIGIVRDRIPARFGLDPKTDVQVLCPVNKTVLGTANLNVELQQALNPARPGLVEVQRNGVTLREGDKVLQTVNNYNKEVFNGDVGVITRIDLDEQELTVQFDGRAVTYELHELDELMLAYAMSIHRSQGSEYPAVVIPVHMQHYKMLQRNLLYTGLTRGKRLVVLVGTRKALARAVGNTEATRRVTLLAGRLRELAARSPQDTVLA
jgi:exodeoxyribonuclease V alpha subunit